ncbi:CotD family spore coat protein [Oceanobacillus sp. M65]|uniref:CotD family spore coat protein n=1 Tax=Oceanobacillus sp. M65 TaxID=3457435 RepID=UPI003FCC58DA
MRHHGHQCGCGCQRPKQVVHPTKYNCVNQYSESVVEHIHPSHTTVMNHHLVKNKHVFPHSTSVQNTSNSVNQYGGSLNVPSPNQVAGAMSPGMGPNNQVAGAMYPGMGPNGQVAGAMSPGMGHNGQVAGAMNPGYGKHCGGPKQWQKPNKWC